jgi:hypothetical protein
MASKVERLRKAYEFKLGKKIVSKLSDEQIQILSSFYNSLSEDEQRSIDSDIFKGKSNDLIDMARAFAEENEEPPSAVATEEAPPPSGALALYEGTREDDLVDEEVDERILKLLGLEEVFDIDYGTYLTLLKEQMIAARMTDRKLSTEESELLTNEFKRVKGKVGRFKLKKKKIAAESLGVKGAITVSPQKFFLTSKAVIPEPVSTSVETSKDVKDISETLDELLANIRLENKQEKKKSEKEKKEKESARRRAREEELEKPGKKALAMVKKVVAPFQSILDKILRFVQFTLIGFVVDKILKWFADPKNQKKVEVLGRFLKDWWPSLSAAALLFLTPFGGFVRGTIKLIRTLLPRLINLIRLNPITSLAVAGATGAAASAIINEQKREEFAATDPTIVTPKQTRETGKTPGVPQLQQEQILQRGLGGAFKNGGIIPKVKSFFGGDGFNNDVDINEIAYAEGGEIDNSSGLRVTGAGPDTQLIAAQPGEIVMSKSAVEKYGANFFLDLNRKGGGTNIPRMVNNIQLAQGGGIIRNTIQKFQSGGMVGGGNIPGGNIPGGNIPGGNIPGGNILNSLGRFLPRTGTVMAPKGMELGYQNKLLGINVGGINKLPLNQTYSPAAAQRYNTFPSAPSTLSRFESGPLTGRHISIPKTSISRPTSPKVSSSPKNNFVGESFRNFGKNVQTIKGAARRQEEMMRQLGHEPDGYVNLRGQPINLGPQSSTKPVGTPVIATRSQTIVLPPQRMASEKPDIPVKTGTQIPDFKPIANVPYRSMVLKSLGIDDLMGVG